MLIAFLFTLVHCREYYKPHSNEEKKTLTEQKTTLCISCFVFPLRYYERTHDESACLSYFERQCHIGRLHHTHNFCVRSSSLRLQINAVSMCRMKY